MAEKVYRWCRRNRMVSILLSLVAVLVFALLIGSISYAVVAQRARRLGEEKHQHERTLRIEMEKWWREAIDARGEASRQALLARKEARVSRQSIGMLQDFLMSADPLSRLLSDGSPTPPTVNAQSFRPIVREIANRLNDRMAAEPEVQAFVMDTVANVCRGVGLFDEAESLLARSAAIRTPDDICFESARHHFYRGWLAHDRGDFIEAQRLYGHAFETAECCEDNVNDDLELLIADIAFQWGCLEHARRDNRRAGEMFLRSLRLRERHLGSESRPVLIAKAAIQFCEISSGDPADFQKLAATLAGEGPIHEIAVAYINLKLAQSMGRLEQASTMYGELYDKLVNLLGESHPLSILAAGEYAGLLWETGDFRNSLRIGEQAIQRGRRIAPAHHHLRAALDKLGYEFLRGERVEDANRCFEEARTIIKNSDGFDFGIFAGLAWSRLCLGRLGSALDASERLLDHRSQYTATQTAWAFYTHARILEGMGEINEASKFDRDALQKANELKDAPEHAVWLGRLAAIHNHNGEHEKAETILRRALHIENKTRVPHHPRLADRQMALARTLRFQGRSEEAEVLANKALESRRKRLPSDDVRIDAAEAFLAAEEAERLSKLGERAFSVTLRVFPPKRVFAERAFIALADSGEGRYRVSAITRSVP